MIFRHWYKCRLDYQGKHSQLCGCKWVHTSLTPTQEGMYASNSGYLYTRPQGSPLSVTPLDRQAEHHSKTRSRSGCVLDPAREFLEAIQ